MSSWRPYPWLQQSWEHLHGLRQQGKLPHGMLIAGDRGLGKAELAQGLASVLLCREQENAEFACGQCKGCQLQQAGTHPDIMRIGLEEKSKQIKVDQVRKVVDFINKTSQQNGNKVVLIKPAEALNINAANALLKCLEEPTKDSFLLLVSHAPGRLLPTIRSRCQVVAVPKPKHAEAKAWLQAHVAAIDSDQDAEKLLMLAQDNPLLAQQYADEGILGEFDDLATQLYKLYLGQLALVQYAERVNKGDIPVWLNLSQQFLWTLIRTHMLKVALPIASVEGFQQIIEKDGFSKRAYQMLEEIQQGIAEMNSTSNPNTQLLIESLLVRWQAFLRG
ncbi:DNA polymerase III subunit delta' [BD1-7 clade bacterium]|uniref:DNA-directed DNA polymerase n=1 Tax=BD1-7 clade bacterium TaxID=2029982 RepID=A0A5S9P0H8_9GAMM|nr:DNA polymerase III subunit delta' [BD1-7 clade bacterium]CAA0116052.1 DNA polymerase III subunit delta' [BD1-7 clade bacterium]CAA0119725.1 DNA polymerase III subunit delta' [BD1-7 clade bacterium]